MSFAHWCQLVPDPDTGTVTFQSPLSGRPASHTRHGTSIRKKVDRMSMLVRWCQTRPRRSCFCICISSGEKQTLDLPKLEKFTPLVLAVAAGGMDAEWR